MIRALGWITVGAVLAGAGARGRSCMAEEGALLLKPRVSVDEAQSLARAFLAGEPGCRLQHERTYSARGGRWALVHEFYGSHRVWVNARTGAVSAVAWRERRSRARHLAIGDGDVALADATATVREFLSHHYPGFDAAFHMLRAERSADGSTWSVGYGRTTPGGMPLGQGATIEVSCRTGEVLAYRAYFRDVHIDTVPSIALADAETAARGLIGYPITKTKGNLQIDEDALGDQRLIYMVYLTGTAPPETGKAQRRERTVPVTVDAMTGEIIQVYMGDWSLTSQLPPLTREFRSGPFVKFRHHSVELIKRPVVRDGHVLISQLLFEGLGAKITFDEPAGKLTLEKADDPIVCHVGRRDATQDGEPFELPVAPELVKGHPYLPAVLVTRLLGMPVRWDAEKDCLYIDCEGEPEPE